ncbi:phage tail fiber domain-containing protein [Pseudomonas brenneri]
MTVNTISSIAEFDTNGVTTNYPFYFKFLANEDLVVTYINPVGASTTLTLGTHYTVNGAGNDAGGSIITVTALAGPGQLIVSREMDAFQQTSLRNQGKFLAETHEDVFDKLTMLIQQGFAIFTRALTRPFGRDYFFAENRRITSVKDPVDDQDAATKHSVQAYVASVLETGQGPINNAANVAFVRPDTTVGTVQDIGSRLPEKGASVVGWTRSALSSAIISAGQMLNAQQVNIWEFASHVTNKPSANPDSWDWTPAFVAANASRVSLDIAPGTGDLHIVVPFGRYHITSVDFGYRVGLICKGGVLAPFDSYSVTPRTHLIKFIGHNVGRDLTIDMDYALSYGCAVWLRGRFMDMFNVNIWKAVNAWTFGDPLWAADPTKGMLGDSEIEINGGACTWCITAFKAYGQNTIVKFVGGHRAYSFKESLSPGDPRKPAWDAMQDIVGISYGALIYFTGCFVGNLSALTPMFQSGIQPVAAVGYKNSYGRFYLNGCHIETGIILNGIPASVAGFSADDTDTTILQMAGCHGFLTGTAGFLMDAGADCKQHIEINSSCGFYGNNYNNLVYAPKAPVHISESAFSNVLGVDFYQAITALYLVGYSSFCALNASGSSQALSGTSSNIKMPVVNASDVHSAFASNWYNASAGQFIALVTMRSVEVSVELVLTSGAASDITDIYLYIQGVAYSLVEVSGATPRAVFRVRKINVGDVIEVRVAQLQSRSTDGSVFNKLIITGNT